MATFSVCYRVLAVYMSSWEYESIAWEKISERSNITKKLALTLFGISENILVRTNILSSVRTEILPFLMMFTHVFWVPYAVT